MFGFFVKPKLTYEERVNLFKEKYSEKIKKYDEEDANQITFKEGDIVKMTVPNSPEMIVTSFSPSGHSIGLYNYLLDMYFKDVDCTNDNDWRIYINRHSSQLSLKYFDANFVLQEITVDTKDVIKVLNETN